jgi:hypothetical protein
MIKKLLIVANKLDQVGLTKEADYIDRMISKISYMKESPMWEPRPSVDKEMLALLIEERIRDFYGEDYIDGSLEKIMWVCQDSGCNWEFSFMTKNHSDGETYRHTDGAWLVPLEMVPDERFMIKDEEGNEWCLYAEF